jgi:thiamine-phosphate diphosphorylase
VRPGKPALYFLLDLPQHAPDEFLSAFLPRLRPALCILDFVQVRAKELPAGAYVEAVRRVCRAAAETCGEATSIRRGADGLVRQEGSRPLVVVNDRLDVALAAGADGVHVGASDVPPEEIRDLGLPPRFVIGLTCHSLEELAQAPARGADYVGLGTFFPSPTKPAADTDPRPALGRLPPGYPLPIYAVGGITLDRIRDVLALGAVNGVVASSAIQREADPAAAARAFRAELDVRGRPERL